MRGEQETTQEALRISDERLTTVLDTARMAFWIWDPATDLWSASAMIGALFGILPNERFERKTQAAPLVHPEDLPAYQTRVEVALREGGAWHHVFRVVRACDGKVAWLEEHGYATRDSHSGALSVTGLLWEVTERKVLEDSLQAADHNKDEFLATLAHELRNPLAPLRNGLAIARLRSKSDPTILVTLEMMERQVAHIVHLVDDLLDVARIRSGKIELRREPTKLSYVIASSAESASSLIDAHRHTLTINPGSEELWVEGDVDRLTQIFWNLLTNAAKYTDSGGTIEVRIRVENDHAVISVTDDGIGISHDDLTRVFSLFSQVRLQRGRSEGGLGIGLSLVRKLVELHHGEVWAVSEGNGKGSTFTRCSRQARTIPLAVRLPISDICRIFPRVVEGDHRLVPRPSTSYDTNVAKHRDIAVSYS